MAAKHPPMDAPSASGAPDEGDERKVDDLLSRRLPLDSTLPPTPLKDLLAADGATVYVLSTDEALLDVVYRAGGEQYPIFALSSWQELEAAIAAGRCNIALLDADLLGRELTRKLGALERYDGRLVTLVAAKRDDSQELIGYLSDRKIHRLLIKPAALGITRLLLESAVGRALQLRTQVLATGPVFVEDRGRRRAPRTGGRWPAWLLATGLVSLTIAALVVGGLTGSLWPAPTRVPAETRVERAPAPTLDVRAPAIVTTGEQPEVAAGQGLEAPSDRFADILERAGTALSEGRLTEPAGDNALDYYLTVLAADPSQEPARAGLDLVVDALFTRVEGALLDDDLDLAAATLEQIRRAEPASARLAFLETQLERSRVGQPAAVAGGAPGAALPTSAPAAAGAPAGEQPAGELESLLTLATARLGRGQLTDPPGDSAREYLDRAAALAPGSPRVAAVRAELASALLAAATTAVSNDDLARAVALRGAALEQGVDGNAVARLDSAIQAAEQRYAGERQSRLLQLGHERLASGAVIAPADDNALHYLAMLRAENPQHFELEAAWAELERVIEARARAARAARDLPSAETWFQAWTRVAPVNAAAFGSELAVERRQQEYLAVAAPASELRLLQYEPPEYPAAALRDNVEGWVTLEFVVDRNGRTRDVVIAEEDPPGRFDRAALAAVRNYVYAPFELDGRTYERRLRLRLTFTLR